MLGNWEAFQDSQPEHLFLKSSFVESQSERLSTDGLVKRYSMASDVSHSYRGLVGCFSEEIQKELGILVIPRE